MGNVLGQSGEKKFSKCKLTKVNVTSIDDILMILIRTDRG